MGGLETVRHTNENGLISVFLLAFPPITDWSATDLAQYQAEYAFDQLLISTSAEVG